MTELLLLDKSFESSAPSFSRMTPAKTTLTLPRNVPYRILGVEEMSFEEWATIPDNPRQRDTERRAHSEEARHLRKFEDTHRIVAIAVTLDGQEFKLDAHTRCYMWNHGMTKGVPDDMTLIVTKYLTRDRSVAEELYDTFDSVNAVEKSRDKVYGACRSLDIKFDTPMLKDGQIVNAIRRLYVDLGLAPRYNDVKVYDAIAYFQDELALLDLCKPTRGDFGVAFMIGALVTFMLDGEGAMKFWKRYAAGDGSKQGLECDAVQALIHLNQHIRAQGKKSDTNRTRTVGQVISAYQRFKRGDQYRGKNIMPKPTQVPELERVLEKAKSNKAKRASA